MTEIEVRHQKFLVPESGDPCELWISYFQSLQKAVGRNNARMLWLVTWKSNGNSSCTTNAGFNSWLAKNKIDVSSAATRTIADISTIGGNIAGLGKNLSGVLSWGIPLTLGFLVLVIGILLWNTAKKGNATDLLQLHPAGRSATVLKTLIK